MDYTGRIRRLEKQRQLGIPELSLSPLIQLCLRDLWCLAPVITPLNPPHSLDAWAQALPKLLSLVNVRWYQFVLLQGHLEWRRVKSKQTRHSQCWCLAGDVCVLTPAYSTESPRPPSATNTSGEKGKGCGDMARRPFRSDLSCSCRLDDKISPLCGSILTVSKHASTLCQGQGSEELNDFHMKTFCSLDTSSNHVRCQVNPSVHQKVTRLVAEPISQRE